MHRKERNSNNSSNFHQRELIGTATLSKRQQIVEMMLAEFPQVRHVFLASGTCLPLRPVEHWLASVNEWHGMRQRLQKCRSMQQVGTDDDYKQYYYNHTQTIREFVAAHPSHKLVEFDVEAVVSGTALEHATGVPSTCWGQRNCLASCRFWRRQSRSAPTTS